MKKTAILCLGAAILLSSLAVGCSGGSEAGGSIEFKTIKSGTTYRLLNSAREFGADGDITYADSVCLLMPVRIAGSRVLSARDIFRPETTDSLVATIQTQADALEQVIGPTTITALPANDNFMLAPGGEIVFVYQPYEVASYAQGKIRVSFYPYELVDYMTPFAVNYFKLSDIGR